MLPAILHPLLAASLVAAPVHLDYRVSLTDPAGKRARIELTIDDPDGGLRLRPGPGFVESGTPFPLEDFEARTETGEAVDWTGERNLWTIGAADSPLRISWTVSLTRRESAEIRRGGNQFQASYVAPDHAMLCTEELFLLPEERATEDIRVRFEVPDGWPVIPPWPEVEESVFGPASAQHLVSDIVAVGHWAVQRHRIGELDFAFAIAPGQDRLEKICAEDFTRILSHELELFGRAPCARYLFVFGRAEMTGMGGSPRTSSMTMFVHPALLPDMRAGLLSTLAHEFHHVWVNERILVPDELRWMNEGFTDYFAHLVCARLGITTWEGFASSVGGNAASCVANPRREDLSLVEAGGRPFFEDPNAMDLVYQGGWLLAAWLDRALHAKADGLRLEELMRRWVNDPRWDGADRWTSLEDFIACVREHGGEEIARALDGFARRPFDFDAVAAFAEVGVEIRHERVRPKLELRARVEGTRLTLVEGSCLAQRIGLKAGDVVLEINGVVPEGASDVREAWRRPAEDRIRVVVERAGRRVEIDREIPLESRFHVPIEPFREW